MTTGPEKGILSWAAQAEGLQPIAMQEGLQQEARATVEKLSCGGPGLAWVVPRRRRSRSEATA
jgi:hypothetical protein